MVFQFAKAELEEKKPFFENGILIFWGFSVETNLAGFRPKSQKKTCTPTTDPQYFRRRKEGE